MKTVGWRPGFGLGLLVETGVPAGAWVQAWAWRKWWPQEPQGSVVAWRGLGIVDLKWWLGFGVGGVPANRGFEREAATGHIDAL